MLRRAALYGVPTFGAEWQRCHSALLFALQTRFGRKRVWQRDNRHFDPCDVADDVSIAVVQGLRGAGDRYLAACVERGIPTLVVDLGWLRRERGFWQVSLNGLNAPPPSAPSIDRFEELGLKIFPRNDNWSSTLVLGQVPGDKQHDLTSQQDVIDWGRFTVDEVHTLYPRKRILWRPHPAAPSTLGKPSVQTNSIRPLNELIKNEYVGTAVTYNSTAGVDLLRLGVSVVARGPRTVYTDLVSSSLVDLERSYPGIDRVAELLSRLAYGQYRVQELELWSTLENVLSLHGVTGDW